MKQRDINIEIIKKLLKQLPDRTLECTGRFSITFACFLNEENITIDFDRIVMDCAYDSHYDKIVNPCQVYLDDLSDNGGIENTFTITDLTDNDIERLLQLFDKEKVEQIKKEYNG